jgi:hypothetical protein
MPLFGSQHDFRLIRRMNRELLQDIIEQEIGFYKLALNETVANIYGEALEKTYYNPVKLNCLITRGDQIISVDDFGPDLNRQASFAFLRDDLVDINLVPEVGDIVLWHENYYEVDTVRENQLFVGKDDSYSLTEYGSKFGESISIICDGHLTRVDRVGITQVR